MKIWTLNCHSESGDHYHSVAHWDHKPTKIEIKQALEASFRCDNGSYSEWPNFNGDGTEYDYGDPDGVQWPTLYWTVVEGKLQ